MFCLGCCLRFELEGSENCRTCTISSFIHLLIYDTQLIQISSRIQVNPNSKFYTNYCKK